MYVTCGCVLGHGRHMCVYVGEPAEAGDRGRPSGEDRGIHTAVPGGCQPQGTRVWESALPSQKEMKESQSSPDLAYSCPGAQGLCSEKEPDPCVLFSLPLREGRGVRHPREPIPLFLSPKSWSDPITLSLGLFPKERQALHSGSCLGSHFFPEPREFFRTPDDSKLSF